MKNKKTAVEIAGAEGVMNINHLIEFIYLAETLSFKQTADYFYVSRSVISRHLAALEETLGVRLVDRGNKSVQLTEAGEVFYQEVHTLLRAYADAVDHAREVGHATNPIPLPFGSELRK